VTKDELIDLLKEPEVRQAIVEIVEEAIVTRSSPLPLHLPGIHARQRIGGPS
jgi:hypothetical protein